MRLNRYEDAAAVFLLAKPPMLKDACAILSNQYNNPLLAFLVSRLVGNNDGYESSLMVNELSKSNMTVNSFKDMSWQHEEGHVLCPISRNILMMEVLPMLEQNFTSPGHTNTNKTKTDSDRNDEHENLKKIMFTLSNFDAMVLSMVRSE